MRFAALCLQGDQTSADYDIKLIAGPMLLAKIIIFNVASTGVQVNDILSKLGLLTKVAKKYCAEQDADEDKPFGFLNIVFQRCTHGEMKDGSKHRERKLLDLEGTPEAATRDRIRTELKSSFEGIACHLLPTCSPWPKAEDPEMDDAEILLHLDQDGQMGYLDQVQNLRRDLAAQLCQPRTVPSADGREALCGPNLAKKMEQIAASITDDKVFVMSALDAMDENARLSEENVRLEREKTELRKEKQQVEEEKQQVEEERQQVEEEKERVKKDQELLIGEDVEVVRALSELLGMRPDAAKLLASKLPATKEQLCRLPHEGNAVLRELFEQAAQDAKPHILMALEQKMMSTLIEELNVSEELSEKIVAAMVLVVEHPRDVLDIMADPTQMLAFTRQWAESPACERALDSITLAIRSFLADKAEKLLGMHPMRSQSPVNLPDATHVAGALPLIAS